MSSDLGSVTRPVRRLRIVPNPTAAARAAARPPGGRHRLPDTDTPPAGVPVRLHAAHSAEAVTDVVPAQRVASLTVPPPAATAGFPWRPGA